MKIEDNFIDQENFDKLQSFMWGNNSGIYWFYNDRIVSTDATNTDKFQFIHIFYRNEPQSPFMDILIPILEKIDPVSIFRIKANLRTKTSKIEESSFHTDMRGMSEEKLKQWTTSIFYVNTNNGYTKFEDGTKVESVANRMVTFPCNMKHTGTSCTNEQTRVVINFNYFNEQFFE